MEQLLSNVMPNFVPLQFLNDDVALVTVPNLFSTISWGWLEHCITLGSLGFDQSANSEADAYADAIVCCNDGVMLVLVLPLASKHGLL